MSQPTRSVAEHLPALSRFFFPPVAGTALLWLTSPNDISFSQGLIAFILLCLPWWSYLKWRENSQGELPLFAMVSFMYWIYFALPLFLGNRNGVGIWGKGLSLSDEVITRTMTMVLLGVFFLWLGMKSRIGRRASPKNALDVAADSKSWDYLRILLIVSSLFSFYESAPYLLGEGARQMITIFQSIIPTVIFAILFRNYLKGKATRLDKAILVSFLVIRFLIGLSSGWLGSLAIFVIICTVVYIGERRKIPGFVMVFVLVYALFFQVGKNAFRQLYWYGEGQGSKIERVVFWMNASLDIWGAALSEPTEEAFQGLAFQTLTRVTLLNQAANVLELTPSTVPYQYGRTYSYLGVTFIPRFLWPGKPSVSDANRYYQVAYGLTLEENLDKVAIGVGSLTESYINFGWFGVLFIMFLLGIIFDFFQKTFLTETSGILLGGIGVVLLPKFLIIESQMASFLGGLVQQVLFTVLIMAPIIYFRRPQPAVEEVKLSIDTV